MICAAVAVPLGTAGALLLVRTNIYGRQLAWIAVGSQLAVPLYVFAGGWSSAFGTQGWFTSLGLLGGSPLGATSMQSGGWSLVAVALVHALAALPWVTLVAAIGLQWTHRGQEEQAVLDGGWANALVWYLLPKLRPWLLAAILWCAIPILTEMVVSNLYQVPTVAEQIYLDASRGEVSPLTYVASVLLCSAPLVVASLLLWRRLPNWQNVITQASHFRGSPLDLDAWRIVLSAVTWSAVALLVGLPIFSLLAKAGWQPFTGEDGLTHYGWSWNRLARTAYESITLFQDEFYWSSLLAMAASTLALVTAAGLFAISNRLARYAISLLMLLAISLPGPLVGMLVIKLMNRSDPSWLGSLYDHSIAAPILAQQFRLLPFAWIVVYAIVSSVSRSTWEQAQLEGLSRWRVLCSVILPQSGRTLLVAWLLLAVLSVGELSCSILVLPPGVTTISMRLFEMLHFGMRHQDSGLCGVLLLLGWLVSLATWKTLSER